MRRHTPAAARNDIRRFYDAIVERYEPVNGFLTLGLDGLWRRKAVSFAPAAGSPVNCLDVCCGTGDFTSLLAARLPPGSSVTGADFSEAMLAKAGARFPRLAFRKAPAAELPFSGGAFDLVSVSFAARGLLASPEGLRACLREFLRVLKPGGMFLQLESSVPPSPLVRPFFGVYVRLMTVAAGLLAPACSREAYRFLGSTALSFMGAEEMSREISSAGFAGVEFKRLFLGAAAVHTAVKPKD